MNKTNIFIMYKLCNVFNMKKYLSYDIRVGKQLNDCEVFK